jgi:hypothetical protein
VSPAGCPIAYLGYTVDPFTRREFMKLKVFAVCLLALALTACDQVGSEKWCADMKEKPKSEWTMDQAGDYTKYCVLHMDPKAFCDDLEKKPKSDWSANEAKDYAANCLTGREDKD